MSLRLFFAIVVCVISYSQSNETNQRLETRTGSINLPIGLTDLLKWIPFLGYNDTSYATFNETLDNINGTVNIDIIKNFVINDTINATDVKQNLTSRWIYDVITALLTGLGVVPHGLINQGFQFTILLASPEQIVATFVQIHDNLKYKIVNIFDRVLFGKFEPEVLRNTTAVQSLPGTIFKVTKVKADVVRIGHVLVDMTTVVRIPFDIGIIYLHTYPEPK